MAYRSTVTDVTTQKTVEEIVNTRNNTVKLFEDGHKLIKMAIKESETLNQYSGIYVRDLPSPEDVKKNMDQKAWRHIFNISGMESLMNATQKAEFDKQIENNPPELTLETVKSTLITQYSCQDETFIEGMVDTFRLLDKTFKTNKPFKIGHKVIFKGAVDRHGFWSYYNNSPREMIVDLERIIFIINKRKPPVNSDNIGSKLYN